MHTYTIDVLHAITTTTLKGYTLPTYWVLGIPILPMYQPTYLNWVQCLLTYHTYMYVCMYVTMKMAMSKLQRLMTAQLASQPDR